MRTIMAQTKFPHQPTLRHLLSLEALSEAQIMYGQDLLDRAVVQVVTTLVPPPRAGSLVVSRAGALGNPAVADLNELAGLIVVKPFVVAAESAGAGQHGQPGASSLAAVSLDVELQRLVKVCADAETPLLVLSGFGEPAQAAEDVRLAFLSEVKRESSRLHSHLISLTLAEGLPGLIEELFAWVNRPLAVETADFKILAAKNMGPTPPSQQRVLTEELAEAVNRQLRAAGEPSLRSYPASPFKIGRRLVMPVVLDDLVTGYISAMVKPSDDIDAIAEYLGPAALACMVDFSQRRKEVSSFSATQQSLLKDLLSGRSLSAADQERLEQHFGFDLCDGLLVFAVQVVSAHREPVRGVLWPEEPYISTEIEGTRVFVVPFNRKSGKTWHQEAENLISLIKKGSGDFKVQLGAGRLTETILDLPDSYREARQALIIGSMVEGDIEFVTGYGDLGVKRLIYLMFDHPELDRFYEENLAPLEAYDAEWESELVPTLAVYLKHGANLNSAARALYIHRHTLRYRLEQIADILKVDIDSQEVLLNLQIAFLIKEMKGKAQG